MLVFGAGTDYSLLLVHRYREELAVRVARDVALPVALRESGRPIAASGGTVIAAMLVLLVADLRVDPLARADPGDRDRGDGRLRLHPPPSPPRRPRRPRLLARGTRSGAGVVPRGDESDPDRADAGSGWPGWCGGARGRSSSASWRAGVLGLGNLDQPRHARVRPGRDEADQLERGTEALERHFPPGLGSPLTAVVNADEAPAAVRGDGAARQRPAGAAAPVPGDEAKAIVVLILAGNPYCGEAAGAVEEIRERLHEVAPGGLLGGIPAENLDVEQTNARDTQLIVPLVLLVVGLILIAVLRALVAPAYLIATVLASFAATLGLATFAFTEVFETEGIAFNLELMAFIFLVALGVDYNIFLMTRAREEAAARGTEEGVLAALDQHRRRHHRRRPDPRRHLRHPDPAAARGAGPDRRHRRRRRPPRHLRRPRPPDPGDHLPARRARLVAVVDLTLYENRRVLVGRPSVG